ncbi:D-alanyl-D-alanine carboxypeptidase/D-alanyl-D-alanine-endopeptidase [Klebsiella pneumoniae]|nr:D-alanyl-D-alanine carboxypeptidase/D-alanyl-D-alanine-endopeptidase [Klebsiella pneumoniae]
MRFPRFIIGLTAGIALSAQAANIDEYINQLPAGANLAFMAQKVGASTPEIDYHSQQMALPASTQKVITALAALLQLGPDFRFTTTLETKGSLDGGVLKGDLIARFGGDPTLKRQDIRNMVATLKKAGVQRIEGNVLIDTSVFASHDKAPGWPWNDLTQCFSAPPAAAIVDRNCFSVSLYSAQKPGDVAFIRVASYYPVTMFSQVRTLARGSSEAQYCELDVVPGDLNRYTLTGCLPQRSEPLPLAFAIQDGASYARSDPQKPRLAQAGITYSGTLLRRTLANEPGTVLATSQSAPLHDLLRIMLKRDPGNAITAHRLSHHQPRPVQGVPGTWPGESPMPYGRSCVNRLGSISATLSSHIRRLWPVAATTLIAPTTMMQVLQYIA